MREIRFRARRVVNGEWVYGFVWRNLGGTFIQSHQGNVYGGIHEVDPETVGQYTGLKDRNGVEIYEGDIVKIELESIEIIEIVEFAQGAFWIGDSPIALDNDKCEVIGNIYEHPHLISKEESQ